MDSMLPEQQYQQQPMESNDSLNNTKKSSKLVKAGIFEILFVAIVLVLLFGILNYFNILSISTLWPKYFGFLPQRLSKQSQQKATVPLQQPVSNSTAIVPTEQSAKKILVEVLPNILVPSLVPNPSQIVVKPDKQLKQILNESWYIDQSTVSATLFTLANGRDVASLNLYITKGGSISPSPELAKTATSQVFVIAPKGTWSCRPLNNQITYCENFWEEDSGVKRGIGIEGPHLLAGRKPLSFYLFCEHHKESVGLYAWRSCRSEFAESGVQ